ncbi:MAG: ADP-ribosylation factor-like protein [Promethearchaeota archaeon]
MTIKKNQENNVKKKIVILGLDNSGKTSISMSLKGIKNLGAFSRIKPTIGVNIENFKILGSDFVISDLSGQSSYMNEYIQNIDRYLDGANKLIYVIDLQDKERYDIAISYLNKILEIIKKKYDDIEILIFLHKFDQDLAQQNIELNESEVKNLIDTIKGLIPSNLKYKIYKTSIFTVFQKIVV